MDAINLLSGLLSLCAVIATSPFVATLFLHWLRRLGRRSGLPASVLWVGHFLVAVDVLAFLAFPATALSDMGEDGVGSFICGIPSPTVVLMVCAALVFVTTLWLLFATFRWPASAEGHGD